MTISVDTSAPTAKAIADDVTNLSFGTPRNLQDVTGLSVASAERLALLGDGVVDISGVFDDGSDKEHDVFKDINTSNTTRTVTIVHSAQTLTLEVLFSSYDLTRAADGSLTFSCPGQLAATTAYGWS